MIQSAVVVPEPDEQAQEQTLSLKRRQSSISSDTSSKRPRLSPRNSVSHGSPSAMSPPPQRKPSVANTQNGAEERKRSQRLFGNVFSNLNKTSAKPAHRKRDEIEKRQQERLKQQQEEAAEEKKKRREEIEAKRRKDQKIWDEESIHARHLNMRATARFLQTKTRPHLYYKPWELLEDEEKQIKQQIEETEAQIKLELAPYGTGKSNDVEMTEVHPPVSESILNSTEVDEQNVSATNNDDKELVGANNSTDTNPQDPILNRTKITEDNDPPSSDTVLDDKPPDAPDEKPHDDHGGEELVEGQEDDVIY